MLLVRGQPALGEGAQPALLDRGHRLDGMAEADAAAGLDLAKHERVALAGHDIELALAAAPVAVEDAQARVGQIGGGDALAVDAKVRGGGHATTLAGTAAASPYPVPICGRRRRLWTRVLVGRRRSP